MGAVEPGFLARLGVYGYSTVEPVILASLVSEDPLLLIGRAGTGKTFLLNSLSEALGLEHRHYNASFISFDDLVGFPWPSKDGREIRYVETPATAWQAESILVDELNRCKPEHQSRFFSLVHERRLQGVLLPKLRYRWAAMNPSGFADTGEWYDGCQPLDAALADRFAFLVEVADWDSLGEDDRLRISNPAGDGAISQDLPGIAEFVESARVEFLSRLKSPPPRLLEYVCKVASALGDAGLRISPRRARQLARNIIAMECVTSLGKEQIYRCALEWSLPHRAAATPPDPSTVLAAHRTAWESVFAEGEDRWLHEFHSEPSLPGKIGLLLSSCPSPDTGSMAVCQFLASAESVDRLVFSYALFPVLLASKNPPVGAEALNDIGCAARDIYEVRASVLWRDTKKTPYHKPGGGKYASEHPRFASVRECLGKLTGRRRRRAAQFLMYLLSKNVLPQDIVSLEETLEKCAIAARLGNAALHP